MAQGCLGIGERGKDIGRLVSINQTTIDTDIGKVKDYVKANGELPPGIPEATKNGLLDLLPESVREAVAKGGAAGMRVKTSGLLVAAGVALWFL